MANAWRFGLGLVLLAACGSKETASEPDAGSSDAAPDVFVYPPPLPWTRNVTPLPQDDVLRVNHAQVKGTHNSYHVEKAGNTVLDWHYTMPPLDRQLDQDGVRQLELDLHYVGKDQPIQVHHIGGLDEMTTCATFNECLRTIGIWSGAHPNHFPIYVGHHHIGRGGIQRAHNLLQGLLGFYFLDCFFGNIRCIFNDFKRAPLRI